MSDIVLLSRLNLLPIINNNTPIVVLEEIALCHNILYHKNMYINEFIQEIGKKPIGFIHIPFSENEMNIVCKYVNPNVKWTLDTLRYAFQYLYNWESEINIPDIFNYGLQTPNNTFSLNACVLYKICITKNIILDKNINLFELSNICKMLLNDNFSRNILYNIINIIPNEDLIKLYIDSTKLIHNDIIIDDKPDYDTLLISLNKLNNKKLLQKSIKPTNNSDAIVLSIINYNIDISIAKNPINEYENIHYDPFNYIPEDINLKEIYNINPDLLYINKYFNPLLPEDFYSIDLLNKLAIAEGFSRLDIRLESSYTLLQELYFLDTFYSGLQIGIQNNETPFLYENYHDLEKELILCYGNRSQNNMIVLSFTELLQLFKNNNNFKNPFKKGEYFTDININKLKKLCNFISAGDSQRSINDKNLLLKIINDIEFFNQLYSSNIKQFIDLYNTSCFTIQNNIRNTFLKLFYLSMYMRGWSGIGPYPITNAPVDNQNIVDINVTNAINDFENYYSMLPNNISQLILNLPLLDYHSGKFSPLNIEEFGNTIGQKLSIIKSGENYDNTDSCIRLCSNFFATSIYRYFDLLNMDLPFDINDLRYIS
jgi:hypothetical protein